MDAVLRNVIWLLMVAALPAKPEPDTLPAGMHAQLLSMAALFLTEKQKEQLHGLMEDDLQDLSAWEESIARAYPQTSVLHLHEQSPDRECTKLDDVRCDEHGMQEGSLFCGLMYFFQRVAVDQFHRTVPPARQPIVVPEQLPALTQVGASDLTFSSRLRWLITLIADAHQPLRLLRGLHDYGRAVNVSWAGDVYTLFDFWDTYLPSAAVVPTDRKKLEHQFQERAMNWGYLTVPENLRLWAQEASRAACAQIYPEVETLSPGVPLMVTEIMYRKWLALAQTYSTLGAQRIAYVIQDLLEPRSDPLSHVERLKSRRPRLPWKNFAKNACIAAVVVPSLVSFFRWHERRVHDNVRMLSKKDYKTADWA